MLIDSLKLEGSILGYGYPKPEASKNGVAKNGGSGGYIYIKVNNRLNQSVVEPSALINVNGGTGQAGGLGGAGGLIVLDKLNVPSDNIDDRPGQSHFVDGSVDMNPSSACKHGAPGMIYSVDTDSLTINQDGTYSSKRVYLYGNTTKQLSFKTLSMMDNS